MCHALGVFHHQARSDRENYIYVNTSNILPDDDSQAQYDKLSTSESNNFNTLYDYGSVMHYSDSKSLAVEYTIFRWIHEW